MRVPFVVPDCPRRAPWGRFIPSILLGGCLAWSGSARGAVFDYSGSLPVTASFNPPTVTYSVVDQGQVRPGSTTVPTGNVFNGTRRDDVVAWNDGATVYLRFYDPARTNWIGTNIAGNPFSLASANGVVAWSAGGFVFSWAYDRARGQWVAAPAVPTGGASVTALHTTNGVVAWATSTGSIFYQAYDPATRSWAQAGTGGAATSFLTLADGVVAWVSGSGTGTRVYYRTYDAARHAWREGQHAPGLSVSTFLNAQGMVVWYVAGLQPRVHVRIYDPVRDAWQAAEQATAQTFNLAIVNATATWSANNVSFLGGYNAHAGVWTNGHTAPYAYFVASTNRGDAPLPVYFADMSLGGSAWNWSFGDNTVTNTRSPFHRFTVFTNTTARLTVTGLLPSHSASLTITNDITPPAGQIVIEGGLSLTTNRVVRLDVAATDNSGVVAEMRFSNTNNQSWGPWGPFATNATWSLDAGVGTRTVFAQFRDRSGNVSALTNDTIELDTTPLRRAFFNPTNISALEAAGQITLEVLLEAPFTRPVAVQYTSVNGSAAAGSDFEPAAGTLVFAPGQTNATFPFRILDDNAVELNETLTFELTVISNALASPPFTFAILDEDPPSVGFAATGYSVGETSGVAVIHVHLSAPSGRDVWV
ncbi:MAG TPA: Calx-beta domain-containing protein, partial [Methylomirabilota bacterium]|nr:Calx-beta domain-containing protein [Methylomirabilota bacterium]